MARAIEVRARRGPSAQWFPCPCSSSCCARGRACCSGQWRCCRPCCGRSCRRCSMRRRPASSRWCWRSATNSSSAPNSVRRSRSGSPRSRTALAGMSGVYLLSQLCIVVTFWAVFALGRAMVGAPHAVMAVMLMAGIAVFSVPTPEFGPAILATPLWALILLHYWMGATAGRVDLLGRARRRGGPAAAHHLCRADPDRASRRSTRLATAFGRAQVETVGPWIAGVAMIAVLFPYLIWLDLSAGISFLDLATIAGNLRTWGWLVVALLLSHAGMAILIALGRGTLIALARHAAGGHARAGPSGGARLCLFLRARADRGDGPVRAVHPPAGEFPGGAAGGDVGARGDRRGRRADQDRAPVSDRLCLDRAASCCRRCSWRSRSCSSPGPSRPICGSGGRPTRWDSSSATASRAAPGGRSRSWPATRRWPRWWRSARRAGRAFILKPRPTIARV